MNLNNPDPCPNWGLNPRSLISKYYLFIFMLSWGTHMWSLQLEYFLLIDMNLSQTLGWWTWLFLLIIFIRMMNLIITNLNTLLHDDAWMMTWKWRLELRSRSLMQRRYSIWAVTWIVYALYNNFSLFHIY